MSTTFPPKYTNFEAKESIYLDNFKFDTFGEFRECFSELVEHSSDYVYRGISNASFKMYTSAQRQWIDNQGEKVTGYPFGNYEDYLSKIVDRAKTISCVKRYLKKHDIHYNDMWLLSLMQHYGAPSTMLDFSHDIYSSLFFMCDGAGKPSADDELDNYVSLYFMSSKLDWLNATIQSITSNAVQNVRMNIIPEYGVSQHKMYANFLSDVNTLPIYKFIKDGISFVSLEGPCGGKVEISIPELEFYTSYDIVNGRLRKQSGLFFSVFSESEPFAELLLKAETPREVICNSDGSVTDKLIPEEAKKHIHCWNVHKSLIPMIKWRYLYPRMKVNYFIYRKWSAEDRGMEREIKGRFVNNDFKP